MDRETGPSGRGLETYRGYLELLVRSRLDPRLRGKLDPGDLVQQTLTRAVSARDRFRDGDGPLAAWLRTILANVLIVASRKYVGDRRERSLQAALEESSARLEAFLVADQTSPMIPFWVLRPASRFAAAGSRLT